MARPPALCAHCGHDVARGASICGRCSRETVPWILAPRGEIVDVSAWLTVPLGVAVAVVVILVREEHPPGHVVTGVGAIVALFVAAVVIHLGEAHWTSSTGATARTFHGRLSVAHGARPETIVHEAPGQQAVRGDVLYERGGKQIASTAGPLGANPLEVALVAALMGAAARGRIALVETRPRTWKRLGVVRTETPQRYGGTFAITLLARPSASEDAIAEALLGSFYPDTVDDYRGTATGAPADGTLPSDERRTIPLLDVVRTAFPPAQKPGRALRRVLPRVTRDPAEGAAVGALLTQIARGERSRSWIALRDALRRALALRGKQVA